MTFFAHVGAALADRRLLCVPGLQLADTPGLAHAASPLICRPLIEIEDAGEATPPLAESTS